ncbi:hypothetical protein C0Q70_19521 [Pomacea canaliculata]|uniref:Uncharacterized protein n=1 Tax=Pomacea canaliculata TaxID=400727 RepID=A0A2T7NJL8_POMCA|nr:hypothetical protein C0Q70_19521 [Pomacea canaliculata]
MSCKCSLGVTHCRSRLSMVCVLTALNCRQMAATSVDINDVSGFLLTGELWVGNSAFEHRNR